MGEILNNWHAGATPIEGMDALVRHRANKASICCPMPPKRLVPMRRFTRYDCFDGLFISADWHLLKPDAAIYRAFILRDEFRLNAVHIRR